MKVHIPIGQQVLIERQQAESNYRGLDIPVEDQEQQSKGTIIRVSPEVDFFSIGDVVIYDKFTNLMDVEEDGKTLFLLPTNKIFAVLRDEL